MTTAARSRKILIPLATLAAAGAIAVGSGATFTSTTGNTISAATSGTLTQSNTKDGQAIFTAPDIKPGDTVNGTLTITNTGTLPATFTLTEATSTNQFADDNLTLVITDTTTGTTIYDGTFGALTDGQKNPLGTLPPGTAHDYTFTVALDPDADNTQQGKTATATYTWDAVQLDAETTTQ